jgi:hypothetical protein
VQFRDPVSGLDVDFCGVSNALAVRNTFLLRSYAQVRACPEGRVGLGCGCASLLRKRRDLFAVVAYPCFCGAVLLLVCSVFLSLCVLYL